MTVYETYYMFALLFKELFSTVIIFIDLFANGNYIHTQSCRDDLTTFLPNRQSAKHGVKKPKHYTFSATDNKQQTPQSLTITSHIAPSPPTTPPPLSPTSLTPPHPTPPLRNLQVWLSLEVSQHCG